jgi:hypothetical protein
MVKSDVPAFYANEVTGLRLRNVQVDWADGMPDYFSEALRVEHFNDLAVDSFIGRQAQTATGAAVLLRNGSGVSITNSRAMPGTQTFLQLDRVEERRAFVNYDMSGAKQVIAPASKHFSVQPGTPNQAARPLPNTPH